MSAIGLTKACIETLSLRFAKQWFSVLFWFMLGGGIAALSYRLLQELQQCWNPKLTQFQHFGRVCRQFGAAAKLYTGTVMRYFNRLIAAVAAKLGIFPF